MALAMVVTMVAPGLSCSTRRSAGFSKNGFFSAFNGIPLSSSQCSSIRLGHERRKVAPTVCKNYKAKTHKASAKRFRVTGSGMVMRRRAGKQHLLVKKNAKRRNRLSKMVPVKRCDLVAIQRALPYLRINRRRTIRPKIVLPVIPSSPSITAAATAPSSSVE